MNQKLVAVIDEAEQLAVTEVVVMELLAGATRDVGRDALRLLLYRFELVPRRGIAPYEDAAELYRRCRREGETRRMTDCLVAAVAIRAGAELLHRDEDFGHRPALRARHAPVAAPSTLGRSAEEASAAPRGIAAIEPDPVSSRAAAHAITTTTPDIDRVVARSSGYAV